jgi:broad specificity phosphatase PhoE
MTRVILLRHAETATPHVFHGAESDVALSDAGQAASEAIAPWLASFKPEVVVTSAMNRAMATARPLLNLIPTHHVIEPAFHERRVGVLGGTPFTLGEGLWVDTLRAWSAGNVHFTTEGAESYHDVRFRVLAAWQRMIAEHRGKTIVLVAHGIVVKVLILSLIEGWGPTRWHELGKVENLATSELTSMDGVNWQLARLFQQPEPLASLQASAVSQLPKSLA